MITIVVTAAVIERQGRFLLTRRLPGVHLAGHWEFPGGKCHAGETLQACMARELREELHVDATVGEEMLTTSHEYADRRVELHFFRCEVSDMPRPSQGQEMQWASREDLRHLRLPPADEELIRVLSGARHGV
jgi:mutator protein MutT